jgi:hypothetical protein
VTRAIAVVIVAVGCGHATAALPPHVVAAVRIDGRGLAVESCAVTTTSNLAITTTECTTQHLELTPQPDLPASPLAADTAAIASRVRAAIASCAPDGGPIDVRVRVAPNGQVIAAVPMREGLELAACTRHVFDSVRYPRSRLGAELTVSSGADDRVVPAQQQDDREQPPGPRAPHGGLTVVRCFDVHDRDVAVESCTVSQPNGKRANEMNLVDCAVEQLRLPTLPPLAATPAGTLIVSNWRALRPGIASCAAANDVDVVTVHVHVEPSGRVSAVRADVGGRELASCIARLFASSEYPPSRLGGDVSLRYELDAP